MNNIFLVKSPLQLLNAIEAKHHLELDDKDCYLLIMGDRKSYSQLLKLVIASQQWSNVVLLNRVGLVTGDPWSVCDDLGDIDRLRKTLLRSSLFSIRRLNRLARAIKDVQYIFIGNNNSPLMRHFANSLEHQHTVLLDDGTATLDIARQRMEGQVARKANKLSKRIRLAAKRIFQKLNAHQPESVVFFTAYKIEVRDSDRIISNDFSYLRTKAKDLPATDAVYFLGSPLSEVGLMTEAGYLQQLAMVRDEYSAREFVYVAHRRENKQKLDTISQYTGVRVCLFEYPVEYQLAMLGPRPTTIVSFITSALDNLNVILGNSVNITAYHLLQGSYAERERIDAVYAHYQSNASDFFQVKMLKTI
jgi:hypothetical protein